MSEARKEANKQVRFIVVKASELGDNWSVAHHIAKQARKEASKVSEIPPRPECGAIWNGNPGEHDDQPAICTREPGHTGPHDDGAPGANPDHVWVW